MVIKERDFERNIGYYDNTNILTRKDKTVKHVTNWQTGVVMS